MGSLDQHPQRRRLARSAKSGARSGQCHGAGEHGFTYLQERSSTRRSRNSVRLSPNHEIWRLRTMIRARTEQKDFSTRRSGNEAR